MAEKGSPASFYKHFGMVHNRMGGVDHERRIDEDQRRREGLATAQNSNGGLQNKSTAEVALVLSGEIGPLAQIQRSRLIQSRTGRAL